MEICSTYPIVYAFNIYIGNVIIIPSTIELDIYIVVNRYRPDIHKTDLVLVLCKLGEYNNTKINKNYINYDCHDRTLVRLISNKPLKLEWIYV